MSGRPEANNRSLRLTLFAEDTRGTLYPQTTFDPAANRNISRVQNVGCIATTGLEVVASGQDVATRGLDLSTSLTYADSTTSESAGFAATPGDAVGKWQPNIPRGRASVLASWRLDERSTTIRGLCHVLSRWPCLQERQGHHGDSGSPSSRLQHLGGATQGGLSAPACARLTGGGTPLVAGVEIHEMKMNGNVMRMRALEQGLELPAGEPV